MLTLHATTHSISLLPGESYFGCDDEQVETLLGSCVALVLWSELDQAGGMSHVVLPERGLRSIQHGSGYFATEALEWQLAQAQQMGLQPCRFEARIIGGGCMLSSDVNNSFNVGARNIIKVRELLSQHQIPIVDEDVGGHISRYLYFSLVDGSLRIKRQTTACLPVREV